MSDDDVHGFEMDASHPLDDAAAEALLRGSGRDVDPSLADVVGDLRVAYTSSPPTPGAALAAFLTTGSETPTTTSRRSERMLSSLLAKVGVATAAVFAATGGLAMASALPAPVQNAVSHLGVGAPAHHGHPSHPAGTEVDDETTTSTTVSSGTTDETTTVPDGSTTTTVAGEHPDNHGADVAAVAHDDTLQGCEHGHAVAAVASNGKAKDQACPSTTSTTLADGTTTTTVVGHEGDDQGDGETTTTVAGAASTNSGSDHGNSGNHGNAGDHGNGSSGAHGND